MRRFTSAAVAIATAALVTSAVRADLVITEIQPQTTSTSAGSVNGDWFEVVNTGPNSINLSGFSWGDTEDTFASGETNFFPNVSLAAGAVLIVLDEDGTNETAWRANWPGLSAGVDILTTNEMLDDATPETPADVYSGLGNAGDGVFLYDAAGNLLNGFSYAQNTRGTTFERSAAGVDLGLSVAGENGAYVGGNGDTGSPGAIVVPEPTTLATLGLAAVAMRRLRSA